MTIPEINRACSMKHITTLRNHGAKVMGPEGKQIPLSDGFYLDALNQCHREKFAAITYELFLPDISDKLMIAIHSDGRVDTGSEEMVIRCLDY